MLLELRQPLINDCLSLRALTLNDFEALYAVASDPLIWQQHPNPQQCQRKVFSVWFDKALESGSA